MDDREEFLCSGSDDGGKSNSMNEFTTLVYLRILFSIKSGKVIIHALYTTEKTEMMHKRSIKAVALEPDYSRKSSKALVSGGMAEQLILSSRGINLFLNFK